MGQYLTDEELKGEPYDFRAGYKLGVEELSKVVNEFLLQAWENGEVPLFLVAELVGSLSAISRRVGTNQTVLSSLASIAFPDAFPDEKDEDEPEVTH